MRRHHVFLRFAWVIVLSALFTLPGCAKKPAGAGRTSAVGSSGQPPTDEEARQFAKSFEANVKAGNISAVNAAMDWEAIINRATVGCEMSAETYQKYMAAGNREMSGPNNPFTRTVNQVTQGGDYRLLHLHKQDGQQRALFRLLLPGGEVNYHDIVLVRQADGRVRGDDMFILLAGEMLSETFRRGALPFAAEASKSLLERLTQKESDYVKNIAKVDSLMSHARAHEGTRVMEIYGQLPDSLKKDKIILIMRLTAVKSLGPEQEDAAIRAFRSAYPHDPALELILIRQLQFG